MHQQLTKRVLLTGATGRIGKALVAQLAESGYEIVLGVRTTSKGWELKKEIQANFPEVKLHIHELDLSSLYSIREFAAEILERYPTIDALVNNAAVISLPQRLLTQDRFESHFGINHLAHFALSGLLVPIMPESSRLVTVYSLAQQLGKLRFHDLRWDHHYSAFRAYSASKLANWLFAAELHRKNLNEDLGIISVAAHPGYLGFDGGKSQNQSGKGNSRISTKQSVEQAAAILKYAIEAPELTGAEYVAPSGLLQLIGEPKIYSRELSLDQQKLAKRLWLISGQLTRINW